MDHYDIIKAPLVTEKSTAQAEVGNKVVFWVNPKANKKQVKAAIEKIFNVKVVSVNTGRIPGKIKKMGKYAGKTSLRKKAYITLKQGDTIAVVEGV